MDAAAKDEAHSEEDRDILLAHMFQLLNVPLSVQLQDLRSTVTRETIVTLVNLAKSYPNEFALYSNKYFSGNEGFLKLLNNGKRLISDMAHEGIIEILNVVCIPK